MHLASLKQVRQVHLLVNFELPQCQIISHDLGDNSIIQTRMMLLILLVEQLVEQLVHFRIYGLKIILKLTNVVNRETL